MTTPAPTDEEVVRRIVLGSRTSFYWPMRLMEPQRRDAMFAIYALARILDDIADNPGAPAKKVSKLADWEVELDALYNGAPTQAVTRALVEPIKRFNLPKEEFAELIRGMAMDARGEMIAPLEADVELYCRRAAGTVGLLSLAVFGRTDQDAHDFALALADALQLTNILRDLAEDADIGRLYLPRERLIANGIPHEDPHAAIAHPRLAGVCREMAAHAQQRFNDADAALMRGGRRGLRPALIMMSIYRRVLARLQSRGWAVLTPKVRLGTAEKLWIALRHSVASN